MSRTGVHRRRSAANSPAEVFAPRVRGNGAQGRAILNRVLGSSGGATRGSFRGRAHFTASARAFCAATHGTHRTPCAFTIHDRGDRRTSSHRAPRARAVPDQEAVSSQARPAFAIYSRAINAKSRCATYSLARSRVCALGSGRKELFADTSPQSRRRRTRLRRSVAVLVVHDGGAEPRRGGGRALRHVLVDEYQDTNRLQAVILRALSSTAVD